MDLATNIWVQLIDRGEALPNEYRWAVLFFLKNEDADRALESVQKWSEEFPGDGEALFYWGGIQIIQGEISEGLLHWQQAGESGLGVAVSLDSLSDRVKALTLEKDLAFRGLELGRMFANVFEWQLALLSFSQVVKIAPGYAEGWAFYGEAQQQCGVDGKAALDMALELNPSSATAQVFSAFYWRRQGDNLQALKYLQQATKIEPNQPMWKAEIGNTLALSGDINGALAYYQLAVALEPDNYIYWEFLAQFCANYDVELKTVGLPAARRALTLGADDAHTLEIMGEVLYKLNDLVGAERFLQQSIDKSDPIFSHLRLAQIYLQQTRMDEAYQQLQYVLKRAAPNSQEFDVAQRLLEQYFGQ